MPRSPMRLLLMRAKVDRLLDRCSARGRAGGQRARRLQVVRGEISERLATAGFPRPVL